MLGIEGISLPVAHHAALRPIKDECPGFLLRRNKRQPERPSGLLSPACPCGFRPLICFALVNRPTTAFGPNLAVPHLLVAS